MKKFLSVRLLGDGEEKYLQQITKATESMTPSGMPKNIKISEVNSILNKAKKSNISDTVLCDMQWQAFDGYMTFLNDFGNGPRSYENKVYDHLDSYLLLLVETTDDEQELKNKLLDVENYLDSHNNMLNDHLYELFGEYTADYLYT